MNELYYKLRNDRIYEMFEKIDIFFVFMLIFTVFINFVFFHTNIFYIEKIDVSINYIGFMYFILFDIGDIIILLLFFICRNKIHSFICKFYGKKRVPYSIKRKLSNMSIDFKDIKFN